MRALFTTLNNPSTCILHMHNRIALKFLSVIFKRGLSNAMTGLLDEKLFAPDALNRVKGSIKKRFDAFVSKVEELFNTQVWGSLFAPTHWQIPVDENEKNCHHYVWTTNAARLHLSRLIQSSTSCSLPTISQRSTNSASLCFVSCLYSCERRHHFRILRSSTSNE